MTTLHAEPVTARHAKPLQSPAPEQPNPSPTPAPATPVQSNPVNSNAFYPKEVQSFKETGLPDSFIESLVFKHLLGVGSNTGRGIARDLALPGKDLQELLASLKNRQLIAYKGSATMGDFEYALTDAGRERAKRFLEETTYCAQAPVTLPDYVESVRLQTIEHEHGGPEALREAFADLVIADSVLDQLGPALNSGRGLFIFGEPGNGKTSIAERVTACFGSSIWIPRALFIQGEVIQFYDQQCHEEIINDKPSIVRGGEHDRRWIQIKRPTIVVGGELTMDALELNVNQQSHITEPSIQLKSNCGTLVIDDFGRQRVDPVALLNRWIVPLEKRYDYLTLANGKKIQVPFDQLIVFSTNLEPKELVDEAFLRRIPYKINIPDPTEEEFRLLMKLTAGNYKLTHDDASVDHLIETYYRQTKRRFRGCHPRDLLLQIINEAKYLSVVPAMSKEAFDRACARYFTLL